MLPCYGKSPAQPEEAGGHGWISATRDHEEIDRIWQIYAADSVGVACKTSGFFALDVDPRDDGDETLRSIIEAQEELPTTVRQITGSGGEHILFKAPSPDWRPKAALGRGIQIKWQGYIVAAPSPHEKTKRPYAWNVDHHPLHVPIAPAPQWLVDLCTNTAAGLKNDWQGVELLEVHKGDRTNTLIKIAGHLFRRSVDPVVAFTLLAAWNYQFCKPPLPLDKLERDFNGIREREESRRARYAR